MGLVCLWDGSWKETHNRRDCKKCKMVYARRWRLCLNGKTESLKHYRKIRYTNMYEAKKEVYKAVRARIIVPASWCSCTDCDKIAEVYDHRDYSRPLEVEPVCKSCNYKRGPGKNR